MLAGLAKGSGNPDLQRRAIQYLGTNGTRENRDLLAEIYASSNDVDVKRRILRSFMVAGDRARVLAAATNETAPELRAEAVRQLGVMGAHDELWQLYQKESSVDVKKQILQAMFVGGNATRLIELANAEQNPELRRNAIRNLGLMSSQKTADALVALYAKEKDPNDSLDGDPEPVHAGQRRATRRHRAQGDRRRDAERDRPPPFDDELSGRQGLHAGDPEQMIRTLSSLALVLLIAAAAHAQQPRIANGQVQPQALNGTLERTLRDLAARTADPFWVGYAVPSANPDSQMCCWSEGGNRTCNLEPGAAPIATTPPRSSEPIRLDSGDVLFVLYRFEQGQVARIRTFSEECPLDGGGRTIHWLTGVRPAESVAVLNTYAAATNRRPADSALSALAMHAEPSALETLVQLARNAPSTHVRGQALFWLAQRAGQKAVGTITEAIEKDPETEVKRRAVFALSQLPKDEGVPLLINVARTHANAAVRKQAIFWLGQSKDPRALKFFEEILFK